MDVIEFNEIDIRKLLLKKITQPSVLVFIVICFFSILTFKFWINWAIGHPFQQDVDQYYSYLVAQFIHQDLSFHFPHTYWLVQTPIGTYVPKVTMGLSILYFPFFVIGNNIAYAFDFVDLGYSVPYAWCIHLGSIFYVLVGIWYTRKSLKLFFNEWITAASILLILFGTNLFYYTYKESEMSHGYLFFLFSVFIFHVLKWRQTNKIKYLYYFSFTAGLVTLIRPTEILILLFPLFIYVSSFSELKSRMLELISLKWKIVLAVFIFLIPIIPQLIFWKTHTGQFFFFSYGSEEGFFFLDPKFYNVLFSWKKGWFIYTPLMLFSIIGLIMMFLKDRKIAIPIFLYFMINLYLICSWWDWGYGGAFGMRALVQTYAFLVFPLAFFMNELLVKAKKVYIKFVFGGSFVLLAAFFCYLNVFQTYQMRCSLMHWDGMTKNAYRYTFLTTDVNRVYLETMFRSPNYNELRKGNRDDK